MFCQFGINKPGEKKFKKSEKIVLTGSGSFAIVAAHTVTHNYKKE
jgi:hypothetical protein